MSSNIKLDSPIWRSLPLDLIREVVDWLITGYENGIASWSSPWYNLKTLSLVCRQWHKRMRPHMWQTLRLHRETNVAALVSAIRVPNSQFRNATKLVFSGVAHLDPRVLQPLGPLLFATDTMNLLDIDWSDAACAHPSWGQLLAGSLLGFKCLSQLHLRNCRFHSSLDVLRMLAALPALSHVELTRVQWTSTSTAVPQKKCNQLTHIDTTSTQDAQSLVPFWSLPHSLALCGDSTSPYPGLKYDEARILTQLCLERNDVPLRTFHMTLAPSPYPQTWTLVIFFFAGHPHERTTIEATIFRANDDDARGRIRWVLIRSKYAMSSMLRDHMDNVGQCLSQLRRLEKVVLEHQYGTGDRATFSKSWAPLQNRLHIRSRKESKAYTLSVMRQGISVRASEQLPVSPRWRNINLEDQVVDEDYDRRSDDTDSSHDYIGEDDDQYGDLTESEQGAGKFTDEEEEDSDDDSYDDRYRSDDDGYES